MDKSILNFQLFISLVLNFGDSQILLEERVLKSLWMLSILLPFRISMASKNLKVKITQFLQLQ